MTFEDLMQTAQKLNISVEALAALAARLLADTEGIALDAQVERSLDRVTTAMGITADELASVPADQRRAVTGMIRSFFRQAADLIDHPGRPPGWSYEDPVILQSQGRGSMALVPIIQRIAADLGDLGSRLSQPGAAFLDVGTGVGWLAVGMAQAFKNLHIVGTDVWPPALRLAAANIAGVKERIELREQDVTLLSDDSVFDAVFLPGPFLPKAVVEIAVARARVALRPGGWLLFGLYAPTNDRLSGQLTDLRVVRSGGHPWQPDEGVALLEAAGFVGTRAPTRTWQMPMTFVVGCRPTDEVVAG